jgi:predicted enzyme related to lactoylglutathione lyase
MIAAVHTVIYAEDAEAARAFFRDVLGWPHVDAGAGWLIFRTGPSELGVHPAAGAEGDAGRPRSTHHQVTLMCEDIESTVAELMQRGARFTQHIKDEGFGRTATIEVPGAGEMMIYEPRHPVAHAL